MIATVPPKLCPLCGAECWRNETDTVKGRYVIGLWSCTACSWDERDDRSSHDIRDEEVEP